MSTIPPPILPGRAENDPFSVRDVPRRRFLQVGGITAGAVALRFGAAPPARAAAQGTGSESPGREATTYDDPILVSAVVGSVPVEPDAARGTDGHTAVTAVLDQKRHVVTSYVRRGTDLSRVPVRFEFDDGTASATFNGAPFANGSTVDLSRGPRVFTVTDGSRRQLWTLERPLTADNPVLPGQYADPDLKVLGGRFWLFPTTDGYPGWSGTQFHAFSSTDLVHWTDHGVILDVDKDANNNYPKSPWSTGSGWAPTVTEKNGHVYFYYCAKDTTGVSAIGVARADNPAGPYTAAAHPIVTQTMGGVTVGQAIDPSTFTDTDNTSYLLYGNGAAAIIRLNNDMMSVDQTSVKLISGLEDFRESVQVVKIGGRYHWTWTVDDTGSPDYHVDYGVSSTLLDPSTGRPDVTYKYTLLAKDSSRGLLGTGHQSVLANGRRYYIAYGRFYSPLGIFTSDLGYHRAVSIDEVRMSRDGYLLPVAPTNTGVHPTKVAFRR